MGVQVEDNTCHCFEWNCEDCWEMLRQTKGDILILCLCVLGCLNVLLVLVHSKSCINSIFVLFCLLCPWFLFAKLLIFHVRLVFFRSFVHEDKTWINFVYFVREGRFNYFPLKNEHWSNFITVWVMHEHVKRIYHGYTWVSRPETTEISYLIATNFI